MGMTIEGRWASEAGHDRARFGPDLVRFEETGRATVEAGERERAG